MPKGVGTFLCQKQLMRRCPKGFLLDKANKASAERQASHLYDASVHPLDTPVSRNPVPVTLSTSHQIKTGIRTMLLMSYWGLDDRQITYLICVRLRHLLYDIFRGCLGPFYKGKTTGRRPKTPPKKSYSKCFLGRHRLDE